jgi:hypothetical protein
MATVVVQMGHVPRTRGATGTSGHRGTEQEFARQLAARIRPRVETLGHRCLVIGADDPIPPCDAFIALHQDGSTNPKARGASVGYPAGTANERWAQTWKARYAQAGWPGGFRLDNYTHALRNYYAFRKTNAPVRVLMEHGFATNQQDADWMWDHLDVIAQVHADTVAAQLGSTAPAPAPEPTIESEDGMELIYIQDRDHWYLSAPGGVCRIADWGKVVFWRDVTRMRVVMMDPASFDAACGPVVRAGVAL